MPCRSVPPLGSVRPIPPRHSPLANFGRKVRFCSSVPLRSTQRAMIKCELNMPVGAIHAAETIETIRA
jgi:hypothetical protein